jgi:MinD superfamily P-loop ATPase
MVRFVKNRHTESSMALVRLCSSVGIKLLSTVPVVEAEADAEAEGEPRPDAAARDALELTHRNRVLRRTQASRQRSTATHR